MWRLNNTFFLNTHSEKKIHFEIYFFIFLVVFFIEEESSAGWYITFCVVFDILFFGTVTILHDNSSDTYFLNSVVKFFGGKFK